MSLKKKINISIVTILILSLLLIVFLILPLLSEIKKAAENFLSQKENLVFLENKAENFWKFEVQFEEIRPNLEKIDTFFIESEAPVEFIRFLENTARDCGISLKISPSLPLKTEKDPWPNLFFQISSVGSFPNFMRFLEKLESSLYLIAFQNLNISRISETELKLKGFEKFSLGDVITNLSLKVYTK